MKNYLFVIIGVVLVSLQHELRAQDEFFHEIIIEKKVIENEKWEFIGEANFKHLYNEPEWRRWGASFAGVKKIKVYNISSGLNTYYTFNKDITNFFELRPWAAFTLNLPIFHEFGLRQRLKYEWRFFYTEKDNFDRENYGRLRYQIGIDVPIGNGEEPSWKIRPFFEWFLIKDPTTFERFSNERDYGITLFKSLKNEHEIFLRYKLEEFYAQDAHHANGHIIVLGYSF